MKKLTIRVEDYIYECDDYEVVHDFYPATNADYLITKKDLPSRLSKGSRIASCLFALGVYYEFFKSRVGEDHHRL